MYKHIELERVRPAIISFHNIIIYVCARKSFSTRELSTFIFFFTIFTVFRAHNIPLVVRCVWEKSGRGRREWARGNRNRPAKLPKKLSLENKRSTLIYRVNFVVVVGKNEAHNRRGKKCISFPFSPHMTLSLLLAWMLKSWLECTRVWVAGIRNGTIECVELKWNIMKKNSNSGEKKFPFRPPLVNTLAVAFGA